MLGAPENPILTGMDSIWEKLRPIDVEEVSKTYHAAEPTHFFCIDDFLQEDFAREVMESYPTYEEALDSGHEFTKLNENKKIQVTHPDRFPAPVRKLQEMLDSSEFLQLMEKITGIEGLTADGEHSGGGMHVMAGRGRLDVHVDFNLIRARNLYRRLNILVFMNPVWEEAWGGYFELWDPDVKRCLHSLAPRGNRCVVFNTTETSYHGVTPIETPAGVTRNSYAAYYYTHEAPAGTTGEFHSTLFRARPDEWMRGKVMAPAEKLLRNLRHKIRRNRG